MSKFALTDAVVHIAGIDATSYTRALQVDLSSEEIDITPLGAPYRVWMDGQRSAGVTLDVFSGLTALEQALRSAYGDGSEVDVAIWMHGRQRLVTDPVLVVPCAVVGFAPFGGTMGEPSKMVFALATSGDVLIGEDQALVLTGVLMVEG